MTDTVVRDAMEDSSFYLCVSSLGLDRRTLGLVLKGVEDQGVVRLLETAHALAMATRQQ